MNLCKWQFYYGVIYLYIWRPVKWLEVQRRKWKLHQVDVVFIWPISINKLESGILMFNFCKFDDKHILIRVYFSGGWRSYRMVEIFTSHFDVARIILVATWLTFKFILFNNCWMRIPFMFLNSGWIVCWYVDFWRLDFSLSAYWSDNFSFLLYNDGSLASTLEMYGKSQA